MKRIVTGLWIFSLFLLPINAQEPIPDEPGTVHTETNINEELIKVEQTLLQESTESTMLLEIQNNYQHILDKSKEVLRQLKATFSSTIETFLINGMPSQDTNVYLTEDLYISENVEFSHEGELNADNYQIYIMPKFYIALNQCQKMFDEKKDSIVDDEFFLFWNQLILNSKTSQPISDLKQQIREYLTSQSSNVGNTNSSLTEDMKNILDFLLTIEEDIPTVKMNHRKFSMSLFGSSVNVSNHAILQINQGNIQKDDKFAKCKDIINRSSYTLEITSGGQLIGADLNIIKGVHLEVEEIPTIRHSSSQGSAIYYRDSQVPVTLSNVNVHSLGESFFDSDVPLYLKMVDLSSSAAVVESVPIATGDTQVIFDQCSQDEEVTMNKEFSYIVTRNFTQQLSPRDIEINASNVDDYISQIPNYVTLHLSVQEDEGYFALNKEIQRLIQDTSVFTTLFTQYIVVGENEFHQVIMHPNIEWDFVHNSALDPFIEQYISINLNYVDLPIHSQYFNAFYHSNEDGGTLDYSYILHSFTDFTPYLYHPSTDEEIQLGDFIEYEEIEIDINYPDYNFIEDGIFLDDQILYEDSVLRLRFNHDFYGEFVDIPISFANQIPRPPKPEGSDDDNTGETTGGGGRDEVVRDPTPLPEVEEEPSIQEPPEELDLQLPIKENEKSILEEVILPITNEISIKTEENPKVQLQDHLQKPKEESVIDEKSSTIQESNEVKQPFIVSEKKEENILTQVPNVLENTVTGLVEVFRQVVTAIMESVNQLIQWFISIFK